MATLTIRNRKAIASPVIGMKNNGYNIPNWHSGNNSEITLYIVSKDEIAPIKYEWERKLPNGEWMLINEYENETNAITIVGDNTFRLKLTYAKGLVKYSNEVVFSRVGSNNSIDIQWFYPPDSPEQGRVSDKVDRVGDGQNVQIISLIPSEIYEEGHTEYYWQIRQGGRYWQNFVGNLDGYNRQAMLMRNLIAGDNEIRLMIETPLNEYYSNVLKYIKQGVDKDIVNPDNIRQYVVSMHTDNFYFSYTDKYGERQEVSVYSHYPELHSRTICAVIGSIEGQVDITLMGACN